METPTWMLEQSPATQPLPAPPPDYKRSALALTRPDVGRYTLAPYDELTFTNILDDTLGRVAAGHTLRSIFDDDPRPELNEVSASLFIRWLRKDKDRWKQYQESLKLATYTYAEESVAIADGAAGNEMEDVTRSTLRVNTRRTLMKAYNRDVFGDTPSLNDAASLAGGISININAVQSPYSTTTSATVSDATTTIETIENEVVDV